ncbi:MAG: hypothetical protein M3Z23_13565 [Acidobacteriota bacterium]|nr:hypothetical protein [Acidobacteriota bacterium]
MSDDVFRWIVAIGVSLAVLSIIVQAIVVLVLYGVVKKTLAKVMPIVERTGPIVDSVRGIVDDAKPKVAAISTSARDIIAEAKPKIASISGDVVLISNTVREQTQKVGAFLDDFTLRAKAKVAKVDHAVDDTVDQVQLAGGEVKKAIMKPVREVNGVLSGIKAALGVYTKSNRASVDHATQDEEMFI